MHHEWLDEYWRSEKGVEKDYKEEWNATRYMLKDITPGSYMNREHWNSVYMDGNAPLKLLRDMIDESYTLILNSLSKKNRKAIIEE